MVESFKRWIRQEGVLGFIIFLIGCSFVWGVFIAFSWGTQFVPHMAPDDDTMHKTVIYFMIHGEDFYSAWRHATIVCGDPSDFRIYRTPLVFNLVTFLTWWTGDFFVFPLSIICVLVAAINLILTFWTTRHIIGSGWAGLAATITQYAYFFNVIPRFQISLFAMPFLILAVYFAWENHSWIAGINIGVAFLIKETFGFALPAFLALTIIRRQWHHTLIYLGTFTGAAVVYGIHVLIAQPIPDPTMIFTASFSMVISNIGGYLWFGFGVLYYNVILPITIGGLYPFSPIPPFLPSPFAVLLLTLITIFMWGPIAWWVISMIRQRRFIHTELAVTGIILWLIPIIITATTPVITFPRWWVDFAVWRWFAPAYVGFQLLAAIGWHNLRTSIKDPEQLTPPPWKSDEEISRGARIK